MKNFVRLFSLLALVLIFAACGEKEIRRDKPTEIVYRQLMERTQDYSVWRETKYQMKNTRVDTIYESHKANSVLPKDKHEFKIPEDAVDLNDILDPNGETNTDWNYTEIDEEMERYLESIGVYWDDGYGVWRKRETK